MRFTPLKDFFSKELRSGYVTGQVYTVRPGNERLAAAVDQMAKDGMVRVIDEVEEQRLRRRAAASQSKVEGKGKVT